MNTNDNRLKAHKLIDHIFQDLLPAHGMAQRPEQIQLSHRMLEAMQDGRIALCDAGTGIGKTYAYLAAATAASAFPTGQIARPIIISTSSIALQNAVLTEYLPLLSCVLMADGILTKPLKAVIRKGKSHYVCDERLDRRLRQVYPAKKNPEALTALRTLIIDRDTFERVQALLQKKAQKEKKRREKSPLALKIVCGNCGTMFQRRSSQSGYVTWVCRTHDRHAADCPVGRIPEAEIHAAFLRMYHRLKSNADIILAPALRQLNTLDTILRQNHPQLLTINRAIAEATEESHKISTLRANGLLDADICAARMNAISARLAQLRGERRRLTENEAIDETMDALRKVEQTFLNGPERLDSFDEELFEHLVEKIIAESQNRIRFRLYGGLELTEQWRWRQDDQPQGVIRVSDPKRRVRDRAGGAADRQYGLYALQRRGFLSGHLGRLEPAEYSVLPGSAALEQA